MKKLLLTGLLFVGIFTAVMFVVEPSLLAATPRQAACDGVALTGGSCQVGANQTSVESVIKDVINILSFVVGVVAVIMIIIGGLKYITSSGDPASTGGAKNTILFALVGLVIVAMAQILVRFVINRVT